MTAANTVPWTVMASIERELQTSYDPPLVYTVENAANMPTSGGALVTLTGINFGPLYKECGAGPICENYPLVPGISSYACENFCKLDGLDDVERSCSLPKGTACDRSPELYISDAVEVYYGPSDDDDQKYECTDAKVIEAGVKVTCYSAEGVGSGFWWKVKVGSKDPNAGSSKLTDQTSQYSVPSFDYPESSYQPPSLNQAKADLLPNNADADSGDMFFFGTNFGIDGSEITMTYGGDDAAKYAARACTMIEPHRSFKCGSVPGVGQHLNVKMGLAGLESDVTPTNITYVRARARAKHNHINTQLSHDPNLLLPSTPSQVRRARHRAARGHGHGGHRPGRSGREDERRAGHQHLWRELWPRRRLVPPRYVLRPARLARVQRH